MKFINPIIKTIPNRQKETLNHIKIICFRVLLLQTWCATVRGKNIIKIYKLTLWKHKGPLSRKPEQRSKAFMQIWEVTSFFLSSFWCWTRLTNQWKFYSVHICSGRSLNLQDFSADLTTKYVFMAWVGLIILQDPKFLLA